MAQPLGKMIVMAAFDEDDEGNLVSAADAGTSLADRRSHPCQP